MIKLKILSTVGPPYQLWILQLRIKNIQKKNSRKCFFGPDVYYILKPTVAVYILNVHRLFSCHYSPNTL